MMTLVDYLSCTEQSIVPVLKLKGLENNHNIMYTTIDHESAIIISDDNVLLAIRLIVFNDIIFLKSEERHRSIKTETNRLDIENSNYYIPASPSLLNILRKRSKEMGFTDITRTLMMLDEKNDNSLYNADIFEINKWLYENNLLDYKFVLLEDIGKKCKVFDKKNTIIDIVNIGNEKYYVWVKEVIEYYTPDELEWFPDLSEIVNTDNWVKYTDSSNRTVCEYMVISFEFIVATRKDKGYYQTCFILLYPDKIITGKTNNETIEKFLSYLENLIYENINKQIILVGFHNEFLENIIIKNLLGNSSEWMFYGRNILHIETGKEIKLLDISVFFPPSTKRKYVKHWTEKDIKYKNFLKVGDIDRNISNLSTNMLTRITYLHTSINNHLCYITDRFALPFFNFDFSGILDIILSRLYASNTNIFYPVHVSAISVIIDSIYADYYFISEINDTSKKLSFKSIFPVIINRYYPEGKPYYTTTPNKSKLSICLCRVEIYKDIPNPILYSKANRSHKKFIGMFTSVDIDTAVELGGYKIKILGCIEWPDKSEMLVNIPLLYKLEDYNDWIISYILKGNITEDCIYESKKNNLPIISFIVSYCRSHIHKLLSCGVYKLSGIVKYKYNQIIYKDT
ncbi:virion release protein [Turkeypox virus]|uniref:Virion release protein n=1 Tax=Turkeypox virus TaxID=336486 RepID=A0A0M3ZJL6_9POXV|nr:virion release protein [Turkeypox virus]ALA62453.1 virion release protein [Turkeypox virus]